MSTTSGPVRLGPDRTALAPVLILALCVAPTAFSARPLLLLLLVPLALGVWVVRARTVVTREGLQVSNGLGTRHYAWSEVEGFDVPRRGWVRLLAGGSRVPLTAVPRRRVAELVAASEQLGARQ